MEKHEKSQGLIVYTEKEVKLLCFIALQTILMNYTDEMMEYWFEQNKKK